MLTRNVTLLAALASFLPAIGAQADTAAPLVHPLWGALPDLRVDLEARQHFVEVAKRYRLGPVETMDVPSPPAPRAPTLLPAAMRAVEKLKFDEAVPALDAAAEEVLASGGAGLNTAELANLFLFQAMASQRATWKEPEGVSLDAIRPDKARIAYLRAAALAPQRTLEPRQFPPLARASWELARSEVNARPRGSIVVRANPNAQVTVNGGSPLISPATVVGLPYGEHFLRVETPGLEPWSTAVTLAEPSLEVEVPPSPPLSVRDEDAAAQARRMGARFALIGELEPGPPARIELRLIDASTGARRDAVMVPYGDRERAALDAGVMRLDEEARRLAVRASGDSETPSGAEAPFAVTTVPADTRSDRVRLGDDPPGWLRQNWPLATAVGVALGAALVLGLATSSHDNPRR